MTARAEVIASELLAHGTLKGNRCACGHNYRLGDSIVNHRAAAVDIALSLADCGVDDSRIRRGVQMVMELNDV